MTTKKENNLENFDVLEQNLKIGDKISFPVKSIRSVNSPSQKDVTTYYLYVNFKDLPNGLPMEVNPRKPKMTTAVAKSLIGAVKSSDTDFDINNRGIVIVAKKVSYNTNTGYVTIDLSDEPQNYGILDGGHTYTAIIQNRDDISERLNKYVKLEVIVGDNLTVSRIADARNTSVTVSDIALFELDDKFDFIKEAVKNEPYAKDIAIKDNSKERLPIIELLKLLFIYNVFSFRNADEVPTQAYSSKASVFKQIKKDLDNGTKEYERLAKLLPKLVKLYDHIERDFSEKYKQTKPNGSKFGAVRGVEVKKDKTLFLENDMNYKIATGYILPVFSAFRVLIDPKDLSWKVDPFELWEIIGAGLIKNTLESSNNNPQDAGKNASIWTNNYSRVETEMLRKMIQEK